MSSLEPRGMETRQSCIIPTSECYSGCTFDSPLRVCVCVCSCLTAIHVGSPMSLRQKNAVLVCDLILMFYKRDPLYAALFP